MPDNSYCYSQLSADSISQWIETHYALARPVICKFYVLGLHDNYLVETGSQKYILRVYRNSWRSLDDIRFELELLAFLNEKNAPVAAPVRTSNGELLFSIPYPEGTRAATLFHYANGHAPGKQIDPGQSRRLAQAVAEIHNLSAPFEPSCQRPVLDLPYLLDDSLTAIAPYIDSKAQDYLSKLGHQVQHALPGIAKDKDAYGICIGDVNPSNFHIDSQHRITVFDFDQCGFGYRAFELGKFNSAIRMANIESDIASAFLEGYQQVRPLNQQELDAIPYYEIVALIWVMAIHACNADRIGYKWLEKPFWDRYIEMLKTCETAVFGR
ncbi:MAG: phosphotransferase [Gammaproteobacteria bacterium]|jgi:Ser/Thr protein kinase RdoA (MazF antagonist)